MAKSQRKEEEARMSGMQYALKIAKEKGIEGLEKDINMRCKYKIPLGVTQDDLNDFSSKVKDQMFDTMRLVVCMVLHDKFGFGGCVWKDSIQSLKRSVKQCARIIFQSLICLKRLMRKCISCLRSEIQTGRTQ